LARVQRPRKPLKNMPRRSCPVTFPNARRVDVGR
jgi:hypothetical protein